MRATLESHNHIVGDIERGVKIFRNHGVEYVRDDLTYYRAVVAHKVNDHKSVTVTFTRDGRDLDDFSCSCTALRNHGALCRHVVAAVLEKYREDSRRRVYRSEKPQA